MRSEQRRQALLDILKQTDQPISAAALAARFEVSRQVIVGDVALLRSAGEQISATPRGYVMGQEQHAGILRHIAVKHGTAQLEAELNTIVDHGCTVLDVIVEHPVYGQLTGSLQLANRYDVGQFINRCSSFAAPPLSKLTGGIHLHTLLCPDEAAFERVKEALHKLGVLLEDQRD
ncbi:MAG: transcription repressor NadR [Oscillospiraceae bacterium]|jgi:transcriptional regulator of NAD metabolism|nr:transcription repressor NadR [Oscillospiraceae bacterium]